MDSRTYRLLTVVRGSTFNFTPGTEHAADTIASLRAQLDAIRDQIPRQEVAQLEQIIDRHGVRISHGCPHIIRSTIDPPGAGQPRRAGLRCLCPVHARSRFPRVSSPGPAAGLLPRAFGLGGVLP